MDQFNRNLPWSYVPGSQIEGGHYVPYVGRDHQYVYVVTWGRVQACTTDFVARFCDEAFAYLSPEFLTAGKSPEGFNLQALQADLVAL